MQQEKFHFSMAEEGLFRLLVEGGTGYAGPPRHADAIAKTLEQK